MADMKHAQQGNRIYSIPSNMSLATAMDNGSAKFIRKAKPSLPAMLFVQLWETADDFDEFCDSVVKDADSYYFTPSSAKQRASKYRSKGIPLKKFPAKSRGIEPLPKGKLIAEIERIRAEQAKKKK
jgi:hypothetical protein